MSKSISTFPAPTTQTTTTEVTYSEAEAAVRLGISKPSLLRLRRDGRIGYYRIGSRVVYSEAEHIRPFLDSCNRTPGSNGSNNGKAA
jgi:excisionase family DNA binding protein